MRKSKEELAEVFHETMKYIKDGFYWAGDGEVDLPSSKPGSKFYSYTAALKKNLPHYDNTTIEVVNKDSFLAAKDLGEGVIVLNMASWCKPGGGVEKGSRAQEEDLCRRSTLIRSLYGFHDTYSYMFKDKVDANGKYPIPRFGGIYTPNVTVFRAPETYSLLAEPFTCSVVSVPALQRPRLEPSGELSSGDCSTMKGKIRTILRIAIIGGHKKIVLGAFGCGAYGNPPAHVARLFKEVLEETEFVHSFEKIVFAIIDDGNAKGEGNFKPFKDVFSN